MFGKKKTDGAVSGNDMNLLMEMMDKVIGIVQELFQT